MNNKIFIGGLSYETTESTLKEELSKYGQVISIRIVTHTETGKSRGFGFATFREAKEAQDAIAGLDNTIFEGRRVGVKESIERGQ